MKKLYFYIIIISINFNCFSQEQIKDIVAEKIPFESLIESIFINNNSLGTFYEFNEILPKSVFFPNLDSVCKTTEVSIYYNTNVLTSKFKYLPACDNKKKALVIKYSFVSLQKKLLWIVRNVNQ